MNTDNTNPVVKESLTTQKEEMEQPNRYHVDTDGQLYPDDEGDVIYWMNYESLQSQFERLQSENDQLKREVEEYESIRSGNVALIAQRNALMNALEFERTQLTSVNKRVEEMESVLAKCEEVLISSKSLTGLGATLSRGADRDVSYEHAFMNRIMDEINTVLSTIQSLKLKGK